MKRLRLSFALALGIANLAVGGAALAHAKIAASAPAANASVAATSTVSITFNERVMQSVAGADVIMMRMPGMIGHKPTKLTGMKPSWSADGRTLTLSAGRPLAPGTYRVVWHAAGMDTHRLQGKYDFTVK